MQKLLHSMCKIHSAEKDDRVSVIKNGRFQVQIYHEVHGSYM